MINLQHVIQLIIILGWEKWGRRRPGVGRVEKGRASKMKDSTGQMRLIGMYAAAVVFFSKNMLASLKADTGFEFAMLAEIRIGCVGSCLDDLCSTNFQLKAGNESLI